MKTKVGLWIDHRKANIVAITERGEAVRLIVSKVEKQLHRLGSSLPKGSHDAPEDRQQRSFEGHLKRYYDAIIACIGDAESILIFGPGGAKIELKRRLEKNKIKGRIMSVEPADNMTSHQIAAKVRRRFSE